MSEMALTADHLVVIGQGRLLADTSMADFIAQNSRSYVRIRTPQRERLLDVLHARRASPSWRPATARWRSTAARPSSIGELAAQHQLVLHELSPQQASLEEAFMQLTAESVEYHAHSDAPRADHSSRLGRRLEGETEHGGDPGRPVRVDQDPVGGAPRCGRSRSPWSSPSRWAC